MKEIEIQQNEELEIDLQRLLNALLNKSVLIGIAAVICAVVVFLGTFFFITPQYQSAAMFYVNNNSLSLGEASLSITSADISASRGLVKSYIVILNTRETLNEVIDYSGVDLTYQKIKDMVTAESVDSTEIFRVVVTSPDPQEAEKIASAIAYILPKRISSIIEGTSAKIVDSAVVASRPSSPSYVKNTVAGFAIGLVLAVVWVVLQVLMDITIRTEEDITQNCKNPVLAAVPDMEVHSKGGSYYGYGRKSTYDNTTGKQGKTELVGGNISFAAAEAYKLLRTKLLFSFADEGGCRVIGVSSALTGEGKSLSAVNLAYTTSQLGKRVLLVDCDMRRPTLADKLPIQKSPGLSDFLSGQIQSENLLQLCGIKNDERAFHAISSGRTPPNPMELLSSRRMALMIERLRQNYDYIILDLPPVGEVGDALAVAKLTDGMLIVVRQNYCDRIALNSAIRQFEFVDAKVLGIIFNATTDAAGKYGKKYYRKYYRQYEKQTQEKNTKSFAKTATSGGKRLKKNHD